MTTKENKKLTSKEVGKLFHEKFSLIHKDLNKMFYAENIDYASYSGFLSEKDYISIVFHNKEINISSITDEPENLIKFIKTLDLKGVINYSKKIIIEKEETIEI